jgi:hypothetical protein
MSNEDMRLIMRQSFVATASDGQAMADDGTLIHPRNYGTFPRKIGRFAIEEKMIARLKSRATEESLFEARRSLDQWFDSKNIVPRVIAEFEDSALLKVFGQHGLGLFFAPSVIAAEVQKQHGAAIVGNLEDVTERFYAISLDRKLKHPAVVAISEAAKARLGD